MEDLEDVAGRAAAAIEEHGFAVVPGALPPDVAAALREHLARQAVIEQDNGIAARDNPYDDSQRIYDLIDKSPLFRDLAVHPLALAVMEQVLGPAFLLSNLSANIVRPGRPGFDSARNLHHDVGFIDVAAPRPRPLPGYPIVSQIIWMLDDFTEENGATRVAPGSHRAGRFPSADDREVATVPLTGPAGSAALFDGRLWHQIGTNQTEDQYRHAVLAYYCMPWVRPQENWPAVLRPGTVAALPDRLRTLLGFDPYVTLGSRHTYPEGLATAGDDASAT